MIDKVSVQFPDCEQDGIFNQILNIMGNSQTEQNKAIVLRFNKEIIERHNIAVLDELVAPDFINHTAPPGASPNRDGLIAFMTMFRNAFSDIQVDIFDQVAEDDKVVTRKAINATHTGPFMGVPATGRRVALNLVDIIRIREGKYAEHWAVRDTASLMQQLTGQ
jgi:steroid delta-isomerase-like uncharacterized protein